MLNFNFLLCLFNLLKQYIYLKKILEKEELIEKIPSDLKDKLISESL